ncbi:MAG: LacI family DNA-binding transcriptional regulator [Caldilineales bacterium]|nr:LacI family DNA-binding transcriptional regulator [Caldilineales bacterium]
MTRSRNTVTISDVAKAAGVSISTVSRVLNEKDDVAEDTYDRVQEVIRDMGYTVNLAAKSMRSRHTNVIGLIMPDVEQPFSVEVMKGVNHAVAESECDLIVYTSGTHKKARWPSVNAITSPCLATVSPMALLWWRRPLSTFLPTNPSWQ